MPERSMTALASRNFSTTPEGQDVAQPNLSGDLKLASKFAQAAPKNRITSGAGLMGGKSEILTYPLNDVTNIPARMRFTVHQIKSYEVDPKAIMDKLDIPLLGFGGDEIKESTAEAAAREFAGGDVAGGEFATGPTTNKNDKDTKVVGGQGGARGNMQATLEAQKRRKESQFIEDDAAGSTAQRATNLRTRRVKGAPIIFLHFPPGLVYQDGVNYNPVDLGPAGQAALGAANAGGSLLSAVGKSVTEGIESIFGLVAGTLTAEAAQVAAARATQFVPREGVRAALQTATQTGINPGSRVIFDKPNLRNFTFQFKLIATSAAEAVAIEQILKSFRRELYPETIDIGGGLPIGYKFPNVFKIEFNFKGGQLKVPKILFSHLRDMTTTINGQAGVFHFDGQPTEVDLTLIFQEYRALSRQDVEAGF
jgi:hypothetical protein